MKTIRTFLFAILLGSLLAGCGAASQPTATSFPESMKGYELYSWQDGGQWKFSLLIGTNREKTLEEIKSADVVLSGVDALSSTLKKFQPDNTLPGHQEKRCRSHPMISATRWSKFAMTRDCY